MLEHKPGYMSSISDGLKVTIFVMGGVLSKYDNFYYITLSNRHQLHCGTAYTSKVGARRAAKRFCDKMGWEVIK